MKVIGSKCYVYRTYVPKGKKFEPRSNIQYLVGYTSTGYRTFDPITGKTTEQYLVLIDEKSLYKNDFPQKTKTVDFQFPQKETEAVLTKCFISCIPT